MKFPTRRHWVGIVVVGVVLAVAAPFPAAAQDVLVSSSPSPDSTVNTELETVSLTFGNELVGAGDSNGESAIRVVGPDGRYYNLGCVQFNAQTVSTSVALGQSGPYEVAWQVVSSDAQPTSDTFEFMYEKPAETVADAGSATAPCSSSDSGGADDGVGEGSHTAQEARTVNGILFTGGLILASLVVAAIAVVIIGSRRSRTGEPHNDSGA